MPPVSAMRDLPGHDHDSADAITMTLYLSSVYAEEDSWINGFACLVFVRGKPPRKPWNAFEVPPLQEGSRWTAALLGDPS